MTSNWESLRGVLDAAREDAAQARREAENPVACPNDGTPLAQGPDGFPFCPFDGWRPAGAPRAGT